MEDYESQWEWHDLPQEVDRDFDESAIAGNYSVGQSFDLWATLRDFFSSDWGRLALLGIGLLALSRIRR